MPFIIKERREIINSNSLGIHNLEEIQPGDRCYVHYKKMIDRWKANPRWTTAHEIFKEMCDSNEIMDEAVAHSLAWQVFFHFKVIPYEIQKLMANGDID